MNTVIADKLRELLKFAEENGLEELTWQDKGMRIAFKRNGHRKAPSSLPGGISEAPEEQKEIYITSPLVGTFRRSVSKDRPPLVVEREHVEPGDRLGIVECMKIPTDVTSFCAGEIAKILVDDGQKVEYGQRLFEIRPTEETSKSNKK
ncbi:MAG: hypothetical protein LHV69_06850 [Elusimicrobia bacterium]|nr:hypothetical protein [Candidatus Obscuribacterium magneticum]